MEHLQRLRSAVYRHHWLRTALAPALAVRNYLGRRRVAPGNLVIDNLARCMVESPVIRIPELPGQYSISADSDIFRRIALSGVYEPELVALCRRYVDQRRDVVDVGANIGLYSVLFAQLAPNRRVLAIEPTEGALRHLKRNVTLNNLEGRVEIFAGAASHHSGEAQINVVLGREEYSSLGAMAHPSLEPSVVVVTAPTKLSTVDAEVEARSLEPGFVKIDVEGMEHQVLAGMAGTLKRFRPIVIAELSDPLLTANGSSARAVVAMMESSGYAVTTMVGEMLCMPK